MARPRFTIKTKVDKRNFLKYLDNNKDKVISSLRTENADKVKEFTDFWELVASPMYILDDGFTQEKHFEDLTKLFYMLPDSVIARIKSSLRANRKPRYIKGKVQMTIDVDVQEKLSSYASLKGLTLSGAIEDLLNAERVQIS